MKLRKEEAEERRRESKGREENAAVDLFLAHYDVIVTHHFLFSEKLSDRKSKALQKDSDEEL